LGSHIAHIRKHRPTKSGMRFKAGHLLRLQVGSFIASCITFIAITSANAQFSFYGLYKLVQAQKLVK
jgi:hypothetical protein